MAAANPNTVVVLSCGGAVELPWADKVRGILYLGLSGEAGGEAAAELLFGDANPGGKLAESWPLRYSDCVCAPYYGERDPLYREGLYVGYRHYASAGIPVRFPFGHGLSYTSFAYSDLAADEGGVSFTLTNTGAVPGAEVAQLYFTPPESGYYRPRLNLCGFARVQLAPGESRRVRIDLDPAPSRSGRMRDGARRRDLPPRPRLEQRRHPPRGGAQPRRGRSPGAARDAGLVLCPLRHAGHGGL